jgi:hypothetical protein
VPLWAEEADWAGIAQFHQIYMPTRAALANAVRQIRALKPAVEVLAPQHGFAVRGDLVPLFLERLEGLLVGLDLLAAEEDGRHLDGYRDILDRLLARAEETMGGAEVSTRLCDDQLPDGLDRLLAVRGDDVRLEADGYSAVVKVFARLARGESVQFANTLRAEVLSGCTDRGLPIPPVGAGLEEEPHSDRIGPDGIDMQPRTLG